MGFEFQNVPPATAISPCETFIRNSFNGVSDSTNAVTDFSGKVNVSSSEVIIYLTDDGTDTGNPLFAGVPFAVVTAQLADPEGSAAPYAFIKNITNTDLTVGIVNISPFPPSDPTDVEISFYVKGNRAS